MECTDLRRRYGFILVIFIGILFASGCTHQQQGNVIKVGMILEGVVNEKPWNEKGYEGLLEIEEELGVDIEVRENVSTDVQISKAVSELVNEGVNLIFGHSSIYGERFYHLAKTYSDVHFVYFNGNYYSENLTSLTFNSHAMGFFAGMIASEMSDTKQVGIIAAYQWQPEIEGFYEGVKYQNPETNVNMEFIYDWTKSEVAIEAYERMKQKGIDVIYPAGDAFSEGVIRNAGKDGLYAIGFVSDQLNIEPETVLTSTVQHVDRLYLLAAKKFNEGKLNGEILSFDFKDDYITLGKYSSEVPIYFQKKLNDSIEKYKETGLLPNQY